MKLRPVLLVLLLVGGFVMSRLICPAASGNLGLSRRAQRSIRPAGAHRSARRARYDAEELNNIAVYKRVLPSVVNITSTTLVFNFFYGAGAAAGAGLGIHPGQGRPRADQLPRGRRRQPRHRGAAQQQAPLLRPRWSASDKTHDLALLQIDAPDLQPVTLADSSRPVRRPEGVRHRQSVRACRHHDARHHQLHPVDSRSGGRADRRRHPDRCGHQSRQLRRAAAELARRGDRDQHHDCVERRGAVVRASGSRFPSTRPRRCWPT